ncbi:Peptide chain release factor RF1 [Ascidiaceihabitans donghaensis]|uniref:Peptide chain release factor RF1 n=1 Tax=Ascidiaceihabitans donghaensis TaxID=1510460 RepID=A0A2R8BA74_9RHOB|nr:peptide chain release factor H [Ascidiaceihabitans donghaensis]SPH19786.1 Peptide chain release factor RF1 [Ascidiaceihabitans donghaensis]
MRETTQADQSVSLLVTSGNGPAECCIAARHVVTRMLEDAETIGLDADVSLTKAKHGIKSALIVLHGPAARHLAKNWLGTVQWRWKSSLRPQHKRANWFVGVFEMQVPAERPDVCLADVKFQSFRAGGPGGQHQNTTDSAVRATHVPSGMIAIAREMRSQHRNKALALERLVLLMASKDVADADARKSDQNQMHASLERGNPVRCFKGVSFRDVH